MLLITILAGMRRGEVCGLTRDYVDFATGSITINKQLKKEHGSGGAYVLPLAAKNDKTRTIVPAPFVMDILKAQKNQQAKWRLKAGPVWEGCPLGDLVFTVKLGRHLVPDTVYENCKGIMRSLGFPGTRLHDLRHPQMPSPRHRIFIRLFWIINKASERIGAYLSSAGRSAKLLDKSLFIAKQLIIWFSNALRPKR